MFVKLYLFKDPIYPPPGTADDNPQLTIPTKDQPLFPSSWATNGPPESPCNSVYFI